jgi:hypothetical protein
VAESLAEPIWEGRGGDGAVRGGAHDGQRRTAEEEEDGGKAGRGNGGSGQLEGVGCWLGLHICAHARDVEAPAEHERHAAAPL